MRFEKVSSHFRLLALDILESFKSKISLMENVVISENQDGSIKECTRDNALSYTLQWESEGQSLSTVVALVEGINGWRSIVATIKDNVIIEQSQMHEGSQWQQEDSDEILMPKEILSESLLQKIQKTNVIKENPISETAEDDTSDEEDGVSEKKYKMTPLGDLLKSQEKTPVEKKDDDVKDEKESEVEDEKKEEESEESKPEEPKDDSEEEVKKEPTDKAKNEFFVETIAEYIARKKSESLIQILESASSFNPVRSKAQLKAAYTAEVTKRSRDNEDEEFGNLEDSSQKAIEKIVDGKLESAKENINFALKSDEVLKKVVSSMRLSKNQLENVLSA